MKLGLICQTHSTFMKKKIYDNDDLTNHACIISGFI